MSISPQWAEYTPSIPVEESVVAASDDARSPYATISTFESIPAESADSDLAGWVVDEDEVEDAAAHMVAGESDRDPAGRVRDEDYDSDATRVGEYTAMPGMPGRGVCLLSIVAAGACAVIDVALARGITMFFDLCFVTICLVAASSVRRRDLFTTGVLPPLIFAAVVGVVAVVSPETFVAVGGASKAFMTGLAQHAPGLVAGYAVALLTVGSRVSASRWR